MKINESKQSDYIKNLKNYICNEFNVMGITTSDWEWHTQQGPGHQGGGGVVSPIELRIFSRTRPIEDIDYSNDNDREVLKAFITDKVKNFIANMKWPGSDTLELSHVYFLYPEECGLAFMIMITLNTFYKF